MNAHTDEPRTPRTPGFAAIALAITGALLLIAGFGAGTFALWRASGESTPAVVTTGRLQLIQGAANWVETTPAIPVADRASGTTLASLAQFRAAPGDSVELRFPVKTDLIGDNVAAVMNVALGTPAPALPAGAEIAGYRVLTQALQPAPPSTGALLPLGTDAVVTALEGPGAGTQLVVAVTLRWGSAATPVYIAPVPAPSTVAGVAIPLVISMNQAAKP